MKPEEKPKRANSKGETKCFNCGGEDHWVDKCPQLTDEQRGDLMARVEESDEDESDDEEHEVDSDGVSMFVSRQKAKRKTLDPHKVYLDSCPTYHQFINDDYVNNIRGADRCLKGQCTGGVSKISQEGDHGDIRVWYNPKGLANIRSLPVLIP